MEWSSQMGRQETEGHSRTHPKLSKSELRIAVHDAWEPGQAVSKPSSLEEGPGRWRWTAVFTFSPGLASANAPGVLHRLLGKQQGVFGLHPASSPAQPKRKETILDTLERGQQG